VAILDQKLTDKYAAYNGDTMEVLPTLKAGSVHLSACMPSAMESYLYRQRTLLRFLLDEQEC